MLYLAKPLLQARTQSALAEETKERQRVERELERELDMHREAFEREAKARLAADEVRDRAEKPPSVG